MLVAFLAGLLSFLSPCVLPVVPSYLSYITGITGTAELGTRRHLALLHAGMFVTGFSLIFILLGATATALGRVLNYYQHFLERAGGALIILFGLYTIGIFKSAWLSREMRFQLGDKPLGFLGSGLAGMAFGAGWTPCIGPILGSILLYITASPDANLSRGIPLMIAYSVGLAIPFLLAAAAFERFALFSKNFRKHLRTVEVVAGVLLIAFGLLLVTGQFTRLAGLMSGLTPGFLKNRL
jgi:cytochrome c-type biogenesis protein